MGTDRVKTTHGLPMSHTNELLQQPHCNLPCVNIQRSLLQQLQYNNYNNCDQLLQQPMKFVATISCCSSHIATCHTSVCQYTAWERLCCNNYKVPCLRVWLLQLAVYDFVATITKPSFFTSGPQQTSIFGFVCSTKQKVPNLGQIVLVSLWKKNNKYPFIVQPSHMY